MKLTRSLIVGVIVAVLVIGGVGFALSTPHLTGASAHVMKIVFPSADGLVSGSDVLEAGSKVGYISDIEPTQSNTALVTLQISDDHWPLHQGLTADIRPKSLLGEKYVDLHDGAQNAPSYNASAVLVASKNADPVELDQFINSLDPPTRTAIRVLLDDLGAGVAGEGYDLNSAIAAGRADLAHLAVTGKTLNNRDPDLDRILVGLDGVLSKITTNDQLNQLSQLIDNGQKTLNDIESVQLQFSRSFTDANVALADLNTAFDGAVPSLRQTLQLAPALISNLQSETSLLASLAQGQLTSSDLRPDLCTGTTNVPIPSSIPTCSPMWMLIKGLAQGPTVSGGALELPTNNPIFRICLGGFPSISQLNINGACVNNKASQASYQNSLNGDGGLFAAFLGS
ncbi:MAG: MCE family protein [Candidatus Dormibacteraeota bacterium]|nr:MCE family protein [Candidatus Dormibacteraeota bacterium]MBV9525309.1 MCE family protein [Candidatus Dormibacteraeota bacterium]